MTLRTHAHRLSTLAIPLLAIAIANAAVVSHAITVNTGVAWPELTAEVLTSPTTTPFGFADRSNSAPFTLTQTFKVGTTFDAGSLFVLYEGNNPSDFSVGLTIFEVADVFAPTITTTPDPMDVLLDTTFFAPPEPNESVMQLYLDAPINLPATTGDAGYAVRFTNDDQFYWVRSGSTGGNPYASGTAYENGDHKSSGTRDFSLALSTEGLPVLTDVPAVQSGSLNTPSTWSNNAAPSAGNRYLIGSPFTVTANATSFDGSQVVVQNGGVLDLAVSGAVIDGDVFPGLVVEAGGTLTSSATGDFAVGSIAINPLARLQLDGTANFTASSAGDDLFVDVDLSGTGDLNFESNGAGSEMFLSAAQGHSGVIRFNGTGDAVRLTEGEGYSTLEMNSTGDNQIFFEGNQSAGGTALVFNQPGEIVHSSTVQRFHSSGKLVANAAVAVDLSSTFTGNERRMFVGGGLEGSADITVTGTATDPSAGSTSKNEFEVGSSGEPADQIDVDTYSGTLTTNAFVDIELRHSQPNASIVINNNATLEMGHEEIFAEFSVALGEVRIASGGKLIVGYERDTFHNPYLLTMTGEGTRDGDLTLEAGSRTVMQVNGTNTEDFDRIIADGDVALGGDLEILVNRAGFPSSFEQQNGIIANTYTPTLGDSFELIALAAEPLVGDYNGDSTVDASDYDLWRSTYGSTEMLAADGNGDGVIDASDYPIWRNALGSTSDLGVLSGTFSSLVVTDPGGVMAAAGLAFELEYTMTAVELKVVSLITAPVAGSAIAAPEPTAMVLLSLGLIGAGVWRCKT